MKCCLRPPSLPFILSSSGANDVTVIAHYIMDTPYLDLASCLAVRMTIALIELAVFPGLSTQVSTKNMSIQYDTVTPSE